MRFEVVSAPVEQRIHSKLQEQTDAAVETLYTIAETLNKQTNRTLDVLSNKEYVSYISRLVCRLFSPTSLPGTFLVLSCIFRLVYTLVVHYLAKHACQTKSKHSK